MKVLLSFIHAEPTGNWGVGSDVDLIAIVEDASAPQGAPGEGSLLMHKHLLPWTRLIDLPVPHDLFVYTRSEWGMLGENSRRFYDMLYDETVWVLGAPPARITTAAD